MNITPLNKTDFEKLFCLMKEAFPPEEYRPKEKQFAILEDPNYAVTVLKEDGDLLAFIAIWKLKGFYFAEHLAVSERYRNLGIGSEFLKEYLKITNCPLVLEVEDLEDELSLRRIGFYKRLGFTLSDIRYDQPNFHKTPKRIPLRIMYNENGKDLKIDEIKKEIFTKVYKKPLTVSGEEQ